MSLTCKKCAQQKHILFFALLIFCRFNILLNKLMLSCDVGFNSMGFLRVPNFLESPDRSDRLSFNKIKIYSAEWFTVFLTLASPRPTFVRSAIGPPRNYLRFHHHKSTLDFGYLTLNNIWTEVSNPKQSTMCAKERL